MNVDIVLDHITTIRQDIEYIRSILDNHIPKPSDNHRPWISMPSFQIEQTERSDVIQISESIVTRISEIDTVLDRGWKQVTEPVVENSSNLYDAILKLNQDPNPNDALLFEPTNVLNESINKLERIIKISMAHKQGKTSKKQYSRSQIQSSIKEYEKTIRQTRLKMYSKLDSDLKKITEDIASSHNEVLDKVVDKLLHLSGFDTEIYGQEIPGNIDVIATDSGEKVVCIFENTTGKISKKKVDQIVGRKTEYENDYNSWSHLTINSCIVCTNDTIFADDLAKRECALNHVSVMTKNELADLVKNVKKGKMSPVLFTEYLKKKIPR